MNKMALVAMGAVVALAMGCLALAGVFAGNADVSHGFTGLAGILVGWLVKFPLQLLLPQGGDK